MEASVVVPQQVVVPGVYQPVPMVVVSLVVTLLPVCMMVWAVVLLTPRADTIRTEDKQRRDVTLPHTSFYLS